MKLIFKFIKNICLGIFALYSINTIFGKAGLFIPINLFSLSLCTFFGLYGIVTLVILILVI